MDLSELTPTRTFTFLAVEYKEYVAERVDDWMGSSTTCVWVGKDGGIFYHTTPCPREKWEKGLAWVWARRRLVERVIEARMPADKQTARVELFKTLGIV